MARFEASMADLGPAVDDVRLLPDALCRAAVSVLPVDSMAVSVYLGGDVAVPIGVSDSEAATAEQLQFTLGEGPCFRSYQIGSHVLIPDVDRGDVSFWPVYAKELTRRTAFRGVFVFPLMPRGLPVGSVGLYRRSAGTSVAIEDVKTVADRIAVRLFDGGLFTGSVEGGQPWLDTPQAERRRHVSLAQGITMQANRAAPAEALALLRAYAYTTGRLLDDVADDIVDGSLEPPMLEPSP
jgi:hypothetical protein